MDGRELKSFIFKRKSKHRQYLIMGDQLKNFISDLKIYDELPQFCFVIYFVLWKLEEEGDLG